MVSRPRISIMPSCLIILVAIINNFTSPPRICQSFAFVTQPTTVAFKQHSTIFTQLYSKDQDNRDNRDTKTAQSPSASSSSSPNSALGFTALDQIPIQFQPLFNQAALTTSLSRKPVTDQQAHDPFRYEWGTWVDDEAIRTLMASIDEVLLADGAYEKLLFMGGANGANGVNGNPNTNGNTNHPPFQFKIASGQDWDCLIHVLPQDTQYEGRQCTGSWTMLKALTGVVEIAMLRENRDGGYKKSTKKDLRGGSDGSFGGGGVALSGEDCIKYVGGPLRSYMGKSGNGVLLELVVRPPISVDSDLDGIQSLEDNIDEYLSIVIPEPENNDDDDKENYVDAENEVEEVEVVQETAQEQAQNLGNKLGMTFDKVGGLDSALNDIVRRVLASRANPEAARRLGISHVRGILLSGPPGCGT